jgi:hypothetical protein
MLKIDRQKKKLVPLRKKSTGSLAERYDLGELIVGSADEFVGEIGHKLFVVAKNVRAAVALPIPIDLLALDPQGEAVIIVMQRPREKSPLARAITCAGMVASWQPRHFLDHLSEEQRAQLKDFLKVDLSQINRNQRAVLVSEAYDFEVLAATKWLRERYDMENVCVRVSLTADPSGDSEYLQVAELPIVALPGLLEVAQPATAPALESGKEAEEPAETGSERRRKPRTSRSVGKNLILEYDGHRVAAQLVDASDSGLGTELPESVEAGAFVNFAGELHSPRFSMRLHGRARVAYCRPNRDGVFRVGLAFEEVQVRKLEPARESEAAEPAVQSALPPGEAQSS